MSLQTYHAVALLLITRVTEYTWQRARAPANPEPLSVTMYIKPSTSTSTWCPVCRCDRLLLLLMMMLLMMLALQCDDVPRHSSSWRRSPRDFPERASVQVPASCRFHRSDSSLSTAAHETDRSRPPSLCLSRSPCINSQTANAYINARLWLDRRFGH